MTPRDEKELRTRRMVRKEQDRAVRRRRRKGLSPLRLLGGLLALAIAAYFCIQVFSALHSPMTTQSALSSSVSVEISAVGYFIRSESLVTTDAEGELEYTLDEGGKVARRAVYANVYTDPQVKTTTEKIRELEESIAAIESAMRYTTSVDAEDGSVIYVTDTSSMEKLSEQVSSAMLNLAEQVSAGEYVLAGSTAASLKSNVVSRDFAFNADTNMETALENYQTELKALQDSIGERQQALYSPKAGYFSTSVDGYEDALTTDGIDELTYAKLTTQLESGSHGVQFGDTMIETDEEDNKIETHVVGKVVTSPMWYFAVPLSEEDAEKLEEGSKYALCFDAVGDSAVTAEVLAINRDTDGSNPLAIFQCQDKIPETIGLRKQSVQIIVQTYTGLRVPKEAVRVDEEGQNGVYVITGLYAQYKPINKIYETREYYIVESDPTSTKNLLLYDRIIVGGKNLTQGLVIES